MRLFITVFLLFPFTASAGFIEIGASYLFSQTTLDDDNYSRSQSTTGSIAYYFGQLSAFEISYTSGISERKVFTANSEEFTLKADYEVIGLDFILHLAAKEAVIRPYLKAGANYILRKKTIFQQTQPLNPADVQTQEPGVAPSAGVGIRFRLTERLGLRAGADAWTSPMEDEDPTIDIRGRLGLSWIF